MSLFFKPRKTAGTASKAKTKAPPVETVKLHLSNIRPDRYACSSYTKHYDFGDRYTAEHNGNGVISIRDNIAMVSGTVFASGKGYWAAVGNMSDDKPAFARGYRLPNATSDDVQNYTLLDDAALLRLVHESQKNDPKAWEAARATARVNYFEDIRYNFGWGALAWGAVFAVATFISWSSQVPGFWS